MRHRFFAACLVFTLLLSICPLVMAQGSRNSGFGSSGFGSSGFGGSGFGSSGFGGGGSGFGSSGFGGGSGFGSSGFGSSGFGSSGFGSGGLGSSSAGFGASRFGNSGSSGMGNNYGGGQNGGQNFIGRSGTEMQNVFGQTSKAGNQFLNQMTRAMGGGKNNNSKRQTNKVAQNPAQPMRVDIQVAIDSGPSAATSAQLANTIRTRMAKILADHQKLVPILTMEGDTAVISGVVASASDREVIANLVSLEPGVRNVRNQMIVATPPSATAPVAPEPGS